MKMKSIGKFLFLFVATAFVFTSCEVDGPEDPGSGALDPSIEFTGTSGGALIVAPGETFTATINASEGASPLQSLTIKQDADDLSLTRISYDGVAANANPTLLFGTDKMSLSTEVGIVAHEDVSSKIYAFEVMDEAGNTDVITMTVQTTGTPATVTIVGPSSFDTNPGVKSSIKIKATAGTGVITTIEVRENGATIEDLTRLEFGSNMFDANPYTLAADYASEIDEMLFLVAPAMEGTYEYLVILTDAAGLESSAMFTMEVKPTGTPVTLIEGVLFNSAGEAGTGGLDLDLGVGVGSMDSEAELRDEGIDIDLPNDSNWLQQISGVNGTEVVALLANTNGIPEDFDFNTIAFSEQIKTFFDAGTAFTMSNSNGKLVSNPIAVGDIFAAKKGEQYYSIEVMEVNLTTGNNEDNYKLNIKY